MSTSSISVYRIKDEARLVPFSDTNQAANGPDAIALLEQDWLICKTPSAVCFRMSDTLQVSNRSRDYVRQVC